MGNYDLQHFRLTHSIPMQGMVDVIQKLYPKMDKPLLSKCLNGDSYGVDLKPSAVKAIVESYAPGDWKKRRAADRHRLKDSVRARLTPEEFSAFTAKYRADGFQDANAWIRAAIQRYISEGQN